MECRPKIVQTRSKRRRALVDSADFPFELLSNNIPQPGTVSRGQLIFPRAGAQLYRVIALRFWSCSNICGGTSQVTPQSQDQRLLGTAHRARWEADSG